MFFFMIFKIVSSKKLFVATKALMLFFSVENHMHLQTAFCTKSFTAVGTYWADKHFFIAVCELVGAQVASLGEPPSTNLFAMLSIKKNSFKEIKTSLNYLNLVFWTLKVCV